MRLLIIFLFLILFPLMSNPCTEGIVIGDFTEDYRPIHWKVRMWTGTNRLLFWNNDLDNDGKPDTDYDNNNVVDAYSFLGIRSNNNIHPNFQNPMMGLNSAGFSIGITIVGSPTVGNTNPLMIHPLCHMSKLDEFHVFLESCPGIFDERYNTYKVSNNYGIMDSYGNCAEFEYEKMSERICYLRRYDAANPLRRGIKLAENKNVDLYGVVARANEFHANGMSGNFVEPYDMLRLQCRFSEASVKMSHMKTEKISILKLLQGIHPQKGNYKNSIIRRSNISSPSTNCSTMIIQGVLPNENPFLSVFWALMGHSDFSIAIPVWILGVQNDVDKLPPYSMTTDIEEKNISFYADKLFQKENNYERVQKITFPLERKIIHDVNTLLLPNWRIHNLNDKVVRELIGKEMNRYQNQTASDVFSLLSFLYLPHNSSLASKNEKHKMNYDFCLRFAEKEKKTITLKSVENRKVKLNIPYIKFKTIIFNYGDGCVTDISEHEYKKSGKYLISVTMHTFFGVSFTEWLYVDI